MTDEDKVEWGVRFADGWCTGPMTSEEAARRYAERTSVDPKPAEVGAEVVNRRITPWRAAEEMR